MIKFLVSIKSYIAAIMAVIGLVSFIWAVGVKSERKTNESEGIKKDVTEIKNIQIKQSAKTDSLYNIVTIIKKEQSELTKGQNAMRNSWVYWLTNQKSLTKEDFIKYMNGLEFQITPDVDPVEKKPEFHISVQKVTSTQNDSSKKQ
jgi:hypothetical protein